MAYQLLEKTIQHFTHCHPLTEFSTNTEFLCDGCKTLGNEKGYRCEACNFDLHYHCGTCPMELSSFMHEPHDLKLVKRRSLHAPTSQNNNNNNDRVCDLCGDPVEGIFYNCDKCDFNVHPQCTKLPQQVSHVMHEDHPLRLQGSVPSKCMVCKDTCASWHYRCGLCDFGLHIECVLLAPSYKEGTTSTSTSKSTPRSLKSPPAGPPLFYHYGYGYGANISAPAIATGVPIAQPYFSPYNNVHGYGIPCTPGVCNVNGQHSSSSQAQGNGGKVRKKMYAIAGRLALGVVSSVLLGAPVNF